MELFYLRVAWALVGKEEPGALWQKQNKVAMLSPHPIRLQAPKCYFLPEEASEQRNPLPSLLMGQPGSAGDGRLCPQISDALGRSISR